MRPGLGGPLALVSQLGLTLVLSILLGLVLGMWVDATLGTKPWATLILSLLGISAGIVGVYRLVTTSIEQATSEMHKNDADKLSDEERGQDRRS